MLAIKILLLGGLFMAFSMGLPPVSEAAADNPRVAMETSMGTMVIELYPDKAPITVKNFLDYVDAGFYDGTIFHRVIPGFVLQGGGFDAKMEKKENQAPIKNEADNGLRNLRATLSMARTQQVNSATSQFFINLKNNSNLDHGDRSFGYAVFAKVVKGVSVIDKMAGVKTTTKGHYQNVPVEPVFIISAKREKAAEKQELKK
ncbi:MAG: peptidylprolyl isomerase [Deltaproteobacteria bacterium]|nr:peptidylprolyl isomerase [Candidatus Tharpella aukensis]